MTSKIVVNNIESDSGIGSVTFTSDIELGTKNLKGHNLESTGIVTATSFSGSGASLTSLPAGNLTGTLPAIDGSNLTGVGASFGNSSVNTSGIITATAFVSSQGELSHRNKVINGAMTVSQRATSKAMGNTENAYMCVDRYKIHNVHDGAVTASQSSTSPDGFGKSLKFDVTTADTSLTGSQRLHIVHYIEAQDLQDLGYGTSSAKEARVSFYVRSNKTGNYTFALNQADNGYKNISIQYTINSANTWERKSFVVPGDTAGVINDDNGTGIELYWWLAAGPTYTSGSLRSDWTAYSNGDFAAGQGVNLLDSTSNEFYLTGVQFEIGPVVTPFEHRKYSEQLFLCQRYYRVIKDGSEDNGGYVGYMSYNYDVNSVVTQVNFIPEMRATPTIASTSGTNYYRYYRNSGYVDINAMNAINGMGRKGGAFNNSDSGNGTAGQAGGFVMNNSSAKIAFDAEL